LINGPCLVSKAAGRRDGGHAPVHRRVHVGCEERRNGQFRESPTLTPPSSITPSARRARRRERWPATVRHLPLDQVETALGKPVVGHTAFIVNIPNRSGNWLR
jgi:hypothetical protein